MSLTNNPIISVYSDHPVGKRLFWIHDQILESLNILELVTKLQKSNQRIANAYLSNTCLYLAGALIAKFNPTIGFNLAFAVVKEQTKKYHDKYNETGLIEFTRFTRTFVYNNFEEAKCYCKLQEFQKDLDHFFTTGNPCHYSTQYEEEIDEDVPIAVQYSFIRDIHEVDFVEKNSSGIYIEMRFHNGVELLIEEAANTLNRISSLRLLSNCNLDV
jgi:hypothetical protein